MLLGDVRQLEVEGERAQDERLPLQVEAADDLCELGGRRLVSPAPPPRQRAHPLLELEQLLALLLDDHPAEDLPEQPDVAPERRVRTRHVPAGLASGYRGRPSSGIGSQAAA